MKKNKILYSLIAVFVIANMHAQQQPPKLVVCITIDQLRGDYLEYFKESFGERGFKRLMNESISYKHVQFEFSNIDYASAFATIFTGSNPYLHGITCAKTYDAAKDKEISCLYDSNYLGNFTHENLSPKKLLSSTIGDELKIASKNTSLVYSVAPENVCAIISAGHAADGAFWIDNYNGKWATTTFYKNMPKWVDDQNSGSKSLSSRLSSISWSQALPAEKYSSLPYIAEKEQYHYSFNEKDVGCYPRFKTTPYANNEVCDLAIRFINEGGLGTQSTPDMLCVSFYAGNFLDVQDKTYTREVQDTYYLLDKNISNLLDAIDKKIGLAKTLIVVTGTGYYTDTNVTPDNETTVGGTFSPNRCTALLNMYLMAIYGQKSWVKGYYNQQIFLNRKTIEDAKLDLVEIQNKAAEFIAEFSGVQNVTTDNALRTGDWNEGTATLHYGTYHIGRGDLIIELMPGWGVEDSQTGQKTNVHRNNAVLTPLFFYGYNLKPAKIDRSVYATEIAPTITHVLRIRAPNACSDLPLSEITK